MTKFTAENYRSGFLLDEELMAGISENSDAPGTFTAYVVRHTTGETLGVQRFNDVFEAIRTINDIPREWTFESTSKCDGNCASGGCGKSGSCGRKKDAQKNTQKNTDQTDSCESC